jgi:hypothetical protein
MTCTPRTLFADDDLTDPAAGCPMVRRCRD